MMEKMRPPSPSQPMQATHGTTPAKNRTAHAQGPAGAGDFLGLLTALGDNLLSGASVSGSMASTEASDTLGSDTAGDKAAPSKKQSGLLSLLGEATLPSVSNFPSVPVLDATKVATDSSVMASFLALQVGFSGATYTPLSATPTDTVSLGATHTSLSATPSATPTDTVSLGVHSAALATGMVATATNTLAAGSRGVAVASSGGELGLVAQTAALDGATEVQAEQGLGAVAKKPTASRWASPATEALAARSTLSLRQESTERPAAQAALVSAVQAAVSGADVPRDPLVAGVGQQQNAWGAPSSSFEPPVVLAGQDFGLNSQGQNTGRGGEGGRGASGQNPDAGALFGIDGLTAEPASVGEAPVFDAASALPAEDAVAEQVSYWVNQNIQNAELTVEHAGHPVEVTVSLSGNEAHVSFRSDQNETRALLDASEAQLRDLLESQGLSLSGMTVGDSATQGNGNNGTEPRNGAKGTRQSATVQASVATDGQRNSAGTITDKAVDIFV